MICGAIFKKDPPNIFLNVAFLNSGALAFLSHHDAEEGSGASCVMRCGLISEGVQNGKIWPLSTGYSPE